MAKGPPKDEPPPQMVEIPPVQIDYPAIEKLIETEDFSRLNKSFINAYEKLESIARKKGGVSRAKQGAKKVMRALERVMDLLTELLRVKYKLVEQKGGEERPPQKK